MKRILYIVIVMFVLGAGVSVGADLDELRKAAGLQSLREQRKYVDFELQSLRGGTKSLSEYEGEVVLLNFWATWCAPCRDEMPSMQTLYERLDDARFEIVAVNLREPPEQVRSFAEQFGLTFPILLDQNARVGSTYGARGLPVTYVISPDGTVVSGALGGRDWTSPKIVRYLEALMSGS